jgi:hypothetical protein
MYYEGIIDKKGLCPSSGDINKLMMINNLTDVFLSLLAASPGRHVLRVWPGDVGAGRVVLPGQWRHVLAASRCALPLHIL